jgi:hypothetical protein
MQKKPERMFDASVDQVTSKPGLDKEMSEFDDSLTFDA